MKRNGLFGVAVVVGCCLVMAGCQKPTASQSTRKAQIVASENLQLKKDIAAKDSQIATLTGQLDQTRTTLTEQLEKLKQDNESLNKQYAEFQKTYEQTVSEYQAGMKAAQESLDAKPTPCEEVEAKYAELYQSLLQMLADCETQRTEATATE